nr:hypothetical protein [Propionivibrio sp.]
MQRPELAKALPHDLIPTNSADARLLKQLCETISTAGDPTPPYAALLERMRGSESEPALREAAAELMQQPFAEEEIKAEFDGAIARLLEGGTKGLSTYCRRKPKTRRRRVKRRRKAALSEALAARGRPG